MPEEEQGGIETPIFPCVNCEHAIPWSRRIKIYCNDFCKEEAKGVRWFRSCYDRGVQDRPDVREAMETRIAFLNSGGYISLGRRISVETKDAVYDKYQGMCAICDGIAIPGEIDHISGSSNDLSNLQYLCRDCHRKKTKSNLRRVQDDDPRAEEMDDYKEGFFKRVLSKNPKDCDNHKTWKPMEKELRLQRKTEYFRFLAPVVKPMIDSRMSKTAIRHKMNEIGVPTISGNNEWSRNSTYELIQFVETL